MVFIVIYPAVAMLAMFVIGVIMILLRWGPQICGVRHHALPTVNEWQDKAYEQPIGSSHSYDV